VAVFSVGKAVQALTSFSLLALPASEVRLRERDLRYRPPSRIAPQAFTAAGDLARR
jgi:hypothetical protein